MNLMTHVIQHEHDDWKAEVWMTGPDLDEPVLKGFWMRANVGRDWTDMSVLIPHMDDEFRRDVIETTIEYGEM